MTTQTFIEAGERTIQKLGRISIADIMNSHNLEPGDVVIVDIRIPYSSDDISNEDSHEKIACAYIESLFNHLDSLGLFKYGYKTISEALNTPFDEMLELFKRKESDIEDMIRGALLIYKLTPKQVIKNLDLDEHYDCEKIELINKLYNNILIETDSLVDE